MTVSSFEGSRTKLSVEKRVKATTTIENDSTITRTTTALFEYLLSKQVNESCPPLLRIFIGYA